MTDSIMPLKPARLIKDGRCSHQPRCPDALPVTIEIRTDDQPLIVQTIDGGVRARPGTAEDPDVVLAGPPDAVIGVLRSRLGIAEARRHGLRIEGDTAPIRRLQPTPSPQP